MTVQNKPVLHRESSDDKSQLPINIVQFGTGVLLRGLVDYIFQEANKKGAENAIAMVKSTSSDTKAFKDQDCLFTVISSGLDEELNEITKSTLVDCVHEVLSAELEWPKIEFLFTTDSLSIAVSNVTEAGFTYNPGIKSGIPEGYPAKLTYLLHKRYGHFNGDPNKGMIIIPTELVVENGRVLYQLVCRHSVDFGYDDGFRAWVRDCCHFCDSLVDRIVPGKWKESQNYTLPYIDNLAIATEPYYLWAIQGNADVQEYFSLYEGIPGFIVTNDLTSYREQKLRLLNGCHTLFSPIAYALGCKTVEEMMNHDLIISMFKKTVEFEILPTLKTISPTASSFYKHMISRWKNPYIKHELKSILSQSITKMQTRNGDTFVRFYKEFGYLPPFLTFGFAIFLRVYQPKVMVQNKYFSDKTQFPEFEFNDQKESELYSHWQGLSDLNPQNAKTRIEGLLQNKSIFNHDFVSLPGFSDQVTLHYLDIEEKGLKSTILHHLIIHST